MNHRSVLLLLLFGYMYLVLLFMNALDVLRSNRLFESTDALNLPRDHTYDEEAGKTKKPKKQSYIRNEENQKIFNERNFHAPVKIQVIQTEQVQSDNGIKSDVRFASIISRGSLHNRKNDAPVYLNKTQSLQDSKKVQGRLKSAKYDHTNQTDPACYRICSETRDSETLKNFSASNQDGSAKFVNEILTKPSCHCGAKQYQSSKVRADRLSDVPRFKGDRQQGRIWPVWNETQDRIYNQLNLNSSTGKMKKIFVKLRGRIPNKNKFKTDACAVQDCEIVKFVQLADVIVASDKISLPNRRPEQILIWYNLESPPNKLVAMGTSYNWTATYRLDSTINTPYERFTFFQNFTGELPDKPARNYSIGKSKMVAWFVSHCHTPNGRMEYALELAKYISVDIYGGCGDLKSPKGAQSFRMLSQHYKFYLAFENSNCVDYITEKLYWNAYLNDVIPVVMGARPEDYRKVAPPLSYIHVDDFQSPRHLAEYLEKLSRDSKKYNSYFRWKEMGTFIDTKFWCRVCSMAHEADISGMRMVYSDLKRWWSGIGTCVKPDLSKNMTWSSWRSKPMQYQYLDPNETMWLKRDNTGKMIDEH